MSSSSPGGSEFDVVLRTKKLFAERGWLVEPEEEDGSHLFEQYVQLLTELSPEEQELVLRLSEDFHRCSFGRYRNSVRRALGRIDQKTYQSVSQCYLIPLIHPSDVGSIKSAHAVMYVCKNLLPGILPSGCMIRAYDQPALLMNLAAKRQDALVLLVDDFIGTGDTAVAAVAEFNNSTRSPTDTVYVLSLVAQQRGVNALAHASVGLAIDVVLGRGISDSKTLDVSAALKTMRGIEKRLRIGRDYRLGYKRSEALVCMERCPNNTFPIFWAAKKKDGSVWPAPYPR